MNERITANEFREALDRRLSGLKADPGLARRIIAIEKGKIKTRKKLPARLIIVIAILFALTTGAYAVTALYRVVTWQGEIGRTMEPLQTPEPSAEETEALQASDEALWSFMSDIPDEKTVYAWYENGQNEIQRSELHKKRKTFASGEAFLRFLSGDQNLSAPACLPDGTIEDFAGEVYMDCAAFGTYELLERGQTGPLRFSRFLIDDSSAVATGYSAVFSLEDGTVLSVRSELRSAAASDEALLLREGESAEKVEVPGMSDALLIKAQDTAYPDGLLMHRKLGEPVRWKRLPYREDLEPDDDQYYREEYVTVWAYRLEEPEKLLKLFSGE